jgi:hypothetical protein
MRQAIYERNVATIKAHNAGDSAWWMGVNQFADLTTDEFIVASGQRRSSKAARLPNVRVADTEELLAQLGALPAAVDWRNVSGMVNPIKDQGQCGSCECATVRRRRCARASALDRRPFYAASPPPPPTHILAGWAFGTAFAVESAHALLAKGKDLVSLSEQQIVSCDKQEAGCNGGDQLPALEWLATTTGLCTEADYPYTSGGG